MGDQEQRDRWLGVRGLSRRQVLALGGMGTATVLLSRCAGLRAPATIGRSAGDSVLPFGPIDRTLGDVAPRAFSGDDPDLAHRVLWDKPAFLAGVGRLPQVEERVPLVVVGGGIAGLTAAWLLRAFAPVVLELAPRFGGNSRGESWRGIDYAIGAAYFMGPDEGSPIATLLAELGLAGSPRVKQTEDPVVIAGRREDHFWEAGGAGMPQVARLARHFRDVLNEEGGQVFPEVPVLDASQRPHIDALDRISFKRYLEDVAGGPLHPHVAAVIEHYCWSSLGASMAELSAAAGLNFYAAEFGDVCVLPGGNAAVAERLLARLAGELPATHFRPSSLVLDLTVGDDGAVVTYLDRAGALHAIHARAVVMACPKFAAAKVVRDLDPARLAAIAKLQYRAYLVANVLLRRPIADDFYDLFLAGDATGDLASVEAAATRQGVTDIVLGTWARPHRERAVLTLYQALPYEGGRAALYEDNAFAAAGSHLEHQLEAEILPLVGARGEDMLDLRIARWGHPLPVAATGLIADHTVDVMRAPFRERVFFVQQDNWALPAFETAVTEALAFAPGVERVLRAAGTS